MGVKCSTLHFGICADTLVVIGSSDITDLSIRFLNADGSAALLLGSAARCLKEYLRSLAVGQFMYSSSDVA